jgi:hypothetical protein
MHGNQHLITNDRKTTTGRCACLREFGVGSAVRPTSLAIASPACLPSSAATVWHAMWYAPNDEETRESHRRR